VTTRQTREIRIGNVRIGGRNAIAVQSMTATRTQDIPATIRQVELLEAAGADVIRIAVDNPKDVVALAEIRAARPNANLSIDLQENYRLAEKVAPYVQKLRYNPGHLYHIERDKSVQEKVAWLVGVARAHDCAMRIGVNAGSVDPDKVAKYDRDDNITPMLESAIEHCAMLDDLGFDQYCVSIKDSDPNKVIDANIRFAAARPDVPLHLGVTEAGTPKQGIVKSAIGIGTLLAEGIGDTIRVSLTADPVEEVKVGKQILQSLGLRQDSFDFVACPSCGRAELDVFALANEVEAAIEKMDLPPMQIAVMGCEVNGPGEARDADIGIAAGPGRGLLFSKGKQIGWVPHDRLVDALLEEAERVAAEIRASGGETSGEVEVVKGAGRRNALLQVGLGEPGPS
jgi:(E)-4-hydroxy-3-methylbut-2-enyl-diphosphate synthase